MLIFRSAGVRRVAIWTIGCLVLWLALPLIHAQQTASTVTFTCDFPGSDPAYYEVSVSSDGHGSYSSRSAPPSSDSDSPSDPATTRPAADVYHAEFVVSQSTADRIFDLASRAHYFAGELDSRKKKLASTGAKTLSYQASGKNTHATYNYSPIPAVQDITAILQGLSATLEFARRLEHDLRYQKLALDEELKRMEEMAVAGSLTELSAAAPILRKIADDATIMNVSRSRAQRLLAWAGSGK
jgi:hypothetical protein